MATLVGLSCAGSNAVGICTLPPPGGPPRRPCRSSPVRCIRHALYHALHHMHALHLAHCIMHASHRAHPTVQHTESWSEIKRTSAPSNVARAITIPQTCDSCEACVYVSIFPALPPSFLKLATQASCIPGAIRKRKRLGSLYSMHSRTPDGPSTSSDPSPASSEDPSSDSPPSESAPRAAPARTPRPRRNA